MALTTLDDIQQTVLPLARVIAIALAKKQPSVHHLSARLQQR
jgi:hypothetical protein